MVGTLFNSCCIVTLDIFQFLYHMDVHLSLNVPYFPPHKTLFLFPLKLSPHITLRLNTSISRLLSLQKFLAKL